MTQVLQRFSTQHEGTRTYLSALFYFIDYLLQVPKDLSKYLAGHIIPYVGKEVAQKMQAEKRIHHKHWRRFLLSCGRKAGKKAGKMR